MKSNKKKLHSHNDVLEAIAEAIDIPEHLYEVACKRYQAIGNWLERDDSTIKQYNPKISPQGSFLLGTVIRPINDMDEYDIDLVCTLDATKQSFTMAALKRAVGVEVIGYTEAHNMKEKPKDKRRCWTMKYTDDVCFHMDVLPSLPDIDTYRMLMEKIGNTDLANNQKVRMQAIAITDKTHEKYDELCNEWPISNPKGYGVWFWSRQLEMVKERKHAIMEMNRKLYASVDEVPDYKVKTPLQQVIQLFKRHRDVMFNGAEDAPISIIITTLSAHAYNGEQTITDALYSILKKMDSFIENRKGVQWVANPVNPKENFADKWAENSEKEKKFRAWLERARRDFGLYLSAVYSEVPLQLQESLSKNTVKKVMSMIVLPTPAVISPADISRAETERVAHRNEATKPWCQ